MLSELQMQINQLLHCYYTAIGVLQRDYLSETIEESIQLIIKEIEKTREIIYSMLEGNEESYQISKKEMERKIEESEIFIENGNVFIDEIIERIETNNK
ncbi:hypothetical protein NUSPORA_02176 [Nucleospora cyclopteri]